jgi:hypothetical protein
MARVEVMWEDEEGTPRVAPGTLDDRSRGGMCVRMKVPIGVGSRLTIKWGNEQVSGTVVNRRLERANYVLGVKRDAN